MNNTELLEENVTKENDIALSIEVKAEEKNNKEEKNEKNIDPHIELLDYLLTFLDTKTDLNYVLLGYFSKLLSNIFLRKPLVICYIYAFSHDKIDKLFYHSSKKGICNILNELISLIDPVVETWNKMHPNVQIGSSSEIRKNNLSKLLKQFTIKEQQDTEKIWNLYELFLDIMELEDHFIEIINIPELSTVFANLNIDLHDPENSTNEILQINYQTTLSLVCCIIKKVIDKNLPLPEYHIPDDIVEQGHNEFKIQSTFLSDQIFLILPTVIKNLALLQNNKKKKIQSTFEREYIPLGGYRIGIIEFMSTLFPFFKKISHEYDKLLKTNNFFPVSFEILFQYEWNNLYQNSLLTLFDNYLELADSHTLLSAYLFDEFNIFEIIKTKINNEEKFEYNSKVKIAKGFYPFLYSLTDKINSAVGGLTLDNAFMLKDNNMIAPSKDEINQAIGELSPFDFGDNDKKKEPEEKSNKINKSLEKYADNQWNGFYINKISSRIKIYKSKLYEKTKYTDEDTGLPSSFGGTGDFDMNISQEKNNDDFFVGDVNVDDFEFTDEDNTQKNEETQNISVKEPENINSLTNSRDYADNNYWNVDKSNPTILEQAIKELSME